MTHLTTLGINEIYISRPVCGANNTLLFDAFSLEKLHEDFKCWQITFFYFCLMNEPIIDYSLYKHYLFILKDWMVKMCNSEPIILERRGQDFSRIILPCILIYWQAETPDHHREMDILPVVYTFLMLWL